MRLILCDLHFYRFDLYFFSLETRWHNGRLTVRVLHTLANPLFNICMHFATDPEQNSFDPSDFCVADRVEGLAPMRLQIRALRFWLRGKQLVTLYIVQCTMHF